MERIKKFSILTLAFVLLWGSLSVDQVLAAMVDEAGGEVVGLDSDEVDEIDLDEDVSLDDEVDDDSVVDEDEAIVIEEDVVNIDSAVEDDEDVTEDYPNEDDEHEVISRSMIGAESQLIQPFNIEVPVTTMANSGATSEQEFLEMAIENILGTGADGTPVEIVPDSIVMQMGSINQIGIFQTPQAMEFPIDEGIVLLTGDASTTFTQNIISGVSGPGYDPLGQLSASWGGSSITHSAVVIEFQIIPDSNMLSFEYLFASGEYNQGITFNDVFALWAVGQDGLAQNIATLPNGNPVNIQTTLPPGGDHTIEGPFYRPVIGNRMNDHWFPFLGHTIVLTADATDITDSLNNQIIQPGVPVTIRLGLANAGDDAVASGVFIKAGSITTVDPDNYIVIHEFVSGTPNRELPEEVLALLPANQTNIPVETIVYPSDDFPTTVIVETGTWVFEGWDLEYDTIIDENIVFVGTWTFISEPDLTELTVIKEWRDDNDSLGLRPENIQVQLLANGDNLGDVVYINEDSDWSFIFTDLPRYDEDDEEIIYTAIEINVPEEYVASYNGPSELGVVTIINTLIPTITKELAPGQSQEVVAGERISYIVTVSNPHDFLLDNHLVRIDLAEGDLSDPEITSLVPISTWYNNDYEIGEDGISVVLSYIPAGSLDEEDELVPGEVVIALEATLSTDLEVGDVIVNSAFLYGLEDEETGVRVGIADSNAIVIIVDPYEETPTPPRISKTSNVGIARVGQYIEYTLTVSNSNSVPISEHLVIDNLANGALVDVRNVSVTPESVGFEYEVIDGQLHVTLNHLPANSDVEITYEARIARNVRARSVVNSAWLSGAEGQADSAVVRVVRLPFLTPSLPTPIPTPPGQQPSDPLCPPGQICPPRQRPPSRPPTGHPCPPGQVCPPNQPPPEQQSSDPLCPPGHICPPSQLPPGQQTPGVLPPAPPCPPEQESLLQTPSEQLAPAQTPSDQQTPGQAPSDQHPPEQTPSDQQATEQTPSDQQTSAQGSPILPQTGAIIGVSALVGAALLATGLASAHKKKIR